MEFRNKQLFFLLGFLDHPILNSVIMEYQKLPTNLTLGDPSPKNIYIEDGQIGICDLENAHQGSHIFEQAHLIAHIMIHNLTNRRLAEFVSEALRGYGKSGSGIDIESVLFTNTVLGLLLYRLASPVIPYKIRLRESQKEKYQRLFVQLLSERKLNLKKLLLAIKIV